MMQRLLLGLVRAYRLLLSPMFGPACRFEPTCSLYAIEALERHGAAVGGYLTLARLGRCHPWCAGGFDPVPVTKPRLFSFLRRHDDRGLHRRLDQDHAVRWHHFVATAGHRHRGRG